MGEGLSPAKVILLAVNLTAHANISALTALAQRYGEVLRDELLLRILLTYLPETVDADIYASLVQDISRGNIRIHDDTIINSAPICDLDEGEATRKARRLHLLPLTCPHAPTDGQTDPVTLFLFHRTYRVNSETGLLSKIPSLLGPFLSQSVALRTWALSTVLPLFRRSSEFYAQQSSEYSIIEFQQLSDRHAVKYLLSETGRPGTNISSVSRDLRCLVSPWLHNEKRWYKEEHDTETDHGSVFSCPGWNEVQESLLSWAANSWTVAVAAICQWDGPRDAYFGEEDALSLDEDKLHYIDRGFASVAIACVYAIPEATTDALGGAYEICLNVNKRMSVEDTFQPIDVLSAMPQNLPQVDTTAAVRDTKFAMQMRHGLLHQSNVLTTATPGSLQFVAALVISAYVATALGVPWTVRRAGDLYFLQDAREQKSELAKIIRTIANEAPKDDDNYWIRCRQTILWLRSWGCPEAVGSEGNAPGPLGALTKEHIETEILKSLLAKSRYSLSRAIFEDASDRPLAGDALQDAVYQSALSAFDNASNPNRNRGGLKKCDEIIHAFPMTLERSEPSVKRIEALLKASHGLSDYRLVLKQGEPFSPVVLRVHSDPIGIIGKVLEQNLKAYTRLQEFLEIGVNMVKAGIIRCNKRPPGESCSATEGNDISTAEKRIVALCIEAALREDDFETAYSYVASRLGGTRESDSEQEVGGIVDAWSWSAALKAGQYVRTERSQQPTHLGTASGNLEIRHLEQRIECLATALRAAPSSELQNILKSFRRCEEQLDSAIREEAANEAAWDDSGATDDLPGSFEPQLANKAHISRNATAGAAARQAEEAPMSLFDLSRATARAAQRNFTALSNLQGTTADTNAMSQRNQMEARTRKRDQLRDAATGTLVSSVGWLIGANVSQDSDEAR